MLDITNGDLFDEFPSCLDSEASPKPSSFTTTHNYTEGVITYDVEYDSDRNCSDIGSYRNISITVEDSVPVVVEFIIPGKQNGPIIQRTGAMTPKRVIVNIEGVIGRNCCPSTELSNACSAPVTLPQDVPGAQIANFILTQNQVTTNLIDGSYSINRTYISTV